MPNFDPITNNEDLQYMQEVYKACTDAVDERLQDYDSDRDDTPLYVQSALGGTSLTRHITVRYILLEQPEPVSRTLPYSPVLQVAPVVALQRLERQYSGLPDSRKIELLDPQRIQGATLLMATLEDHDFRDSRLPRVSVSGNYMDAANARPLYEKVLLDDLLGLAAAINGLAKARKLEPISYMDFQNMLISAALGGS